MCGSNSCVPKDLKEIKSSQIPMAKRAKISACVLFYPWILSLRTRNSVFELQSAESGKPTILASVNRLRSQHLLSETWEEKYPHAVELGWASEMKQKYRFYPSSLALRGVPGAPFLLAQVPYLSNILPKSLSDPVPLRFVMNLCALWCHWRAHKMCLCLRD